MFQEDILLIFNIRYFDASLDLMLKYMSDIFSQKKELETILTTSTDKLDFSVLNHTKFNDVDNVRHCMKFPN